MIHPGPLLQFRYQGDLLGTGGVIAWAQVCGEMGPSPTGTVD